MADKPWDARLALLMVYPLRNTFVKPNHLTALRLLSGLIAAWFLARGDYVASNIGALCFCISHFLDHADGEFARLTGIFSPIGTYIDLYTDSLVNTCLFLGIGLGLTLQGLGYEYAAMGLIAGLAVAAIFHMLGHIISIVGREQARQPHFGGFEIEDILYLLPLVTLISAERTFIVLAAIGAPLFAIWLYYKDYRHIKKQQ